MGIVASILAACAGDRPVLKRGADGRLTECPASPNCVSSQADDRQHAIAPLVFSGDADAAFARLKQVLIQRVDVSVVTETPGYLRVELHTTLFVDDGEFLLDRERSCIHVRSASRRGYYDLGKNRRRLEEIRTQFMVREAKI